MFRNQNVFALLTAALSAVGHVSIDQRDFAPTPKLMIDQVI